MVRNLKKKDPTVDKYHPFKKLSETIIGFKTSLPLIEQLNNPAV
jgi:hypothetical protein